MQQIYNIIDPTTLYGVPPYFVILRETISQKNPAYINILNNLAKQEKYCYKQVSPKTATIETMWLILLILVFVSSIQLASSAVDPV